MKNSYLWSCCSWILLVLPLLAGRSDSSVGRMKQLDELVDAWHLAATNADLEAYFDPLTDDFVFLGTAPGERWTKEAFYEFSKPYFDKGTAWDFKPHDRHWVIDEKRGIAWFDEDLDTWMEGCRGSGIVRREKKSWKLAYYNLTVLIENEKVQEFIELRKK